MTNHLLTIFPDGPDEVGRRFLQQRHDVFIKWVHVFEQPLIADIVHTAGVVIHAEVRLLTEVYSRPIHTRS